MQGGKKKKKKRDLHNSLMSLSMLDRLPSLRLPFDDRQTEYYNLLCMHTEG